MIQWKNVEGRGARNEEFKIIKVFASRKLRPASLVFKIFAFLSKSFSDPARVTPAVKDCTHTNDVILVDPIIYGVGESFCQQPIIALINSMHTTVQTKRLNI
ncbi:hypothetical protein GSUB_15175 [Geoalkalibacter subterraneus]|uniref:Uncharacterized protein n=1 Tax=Geoalkalibacter subterraneus TaxID=483547 RepID=A0A0B5FHF4_9BACT|nr:hypothetical protein GSUB_15175 [Geoalkalibacter subterraneus]